MWDERFATEEYVYGTEPAGFLRAQEPFLRPGLRALAVADGEGRNSVYMAGRGLEVTAMDGSAVALHKARRLAKARGVDVTFQHADITCYDWPDAAYDLVVAIFIQFMDPSTRTQAFDGMTRALKPGGHLLLHGYRPEQVALGTGGPANPDFMYTEPQLRADFNGLEVVRLESYEKEIHEGAGHSGLSALIDLVMRKPL